MENIRVYEKLVILIPAALAKLVQTYYHKLLSSEPSMH